MNLEYTKHIRSGEFTFCTRCGRNVRYGKKEFMCTACNSSLFSKSESISEFHERLLKEKYEEIISKTILSHREELAKLRIKNESEV